MNFEVYFIKERILTQILVVVGMSGGVDSSVTALLLAKNVCQNMQHIQKKPLQNECYLLGFWSFCCFYAELGHSRRIWHRHGMRMGKRLARCSISVQKTWSSLWTCVCCSLSSLACVFSQNFFRLIYHRNIGIGFSNHRWGSGSWESAQIQMFGATSSLLTHWDATFYTNIIYLGKLNLVLCWTNSLPVTNLMTMHG